MPILTVQKEFANALSQQMVEYDGKLIQIEKERDALSDEKRYSYLYLSLTSWSSFTARSRAVALIW